MMGSIVLYSISEVKTKKVAFEVLLTKIRLVSARPSKMVNACIIVTIPCNKILRENNRVSVRSSFVH